MSQEYDGFEKNELLRVVALRVWLIRLFEANSSEQNALSLIKRQILQEHLTGIEVHNNIKKGMDHAVDSSSAVSQKLLEQNEDMIGAVGNYLVLCNLGIL
ncbi:hypothetical protein EON65_40710 [archaeon]|nr:MAG: hypothetical protein EON65_40710 [archaeon]